MLFLNLSEHKDAKTRRHGAYGIASAKVAINYGTQRHKVTKIF